MMKKLILILSCLFLSVGLIYSQNITVNGVVVDDAGIEVIGASVVVKGTSTGVATDIDGKFTLNNVPSNSTLVFSLIGMKKVEMKATPSMQVVMENDNAMLDEVIVTGYGSVKKSTFTGAASTLSTKALEDVPTTSITAKIAGAAAGVQIGAATGAPGALESMRIRGTGSINASNEPLYVLDGIPLVNENAANFTYSDSGSSMLASINSSDIESITIVKDAAGASLYGSRAANGVVLITTKQGGQGKTKVSLKSSWGFSNKAVNYRPTLGGDDRRALLHQGLVNYGLDTEMSDPKAYADREIDKYAERPWSGKWEDWNDIVYRTGNQESYDLSMQGGNAKTNFFSSLSYVNSNGITDKSAFQRITGRLNINHQATDKLKVAVTTSYSNSKQDMVNEGYSFSNPVYAVSSLLSPQDYAYNDDGTLNTTNKFLGMSGNGGLANPLNVLANDYDKNKMNRFLGSISTQYDIYAGVYARQVLSMDYNDVKSHAWWSPSGPNGKSFNGAMQKYDVEYKNFVSQTQLGYAKSFNNLHNFDALMSYEITKYDRSEYYMSGFGYPNPSKNEIENATNTTSSTHMEQKRMISYLVLANYNYDNKYYLSGNYRRDGSSQFARDARWGNFWSVSGSWRISGEQFMEGTKDILSDARLRASYGLNGNLPLGFYDFMDVYQYGNRYNGGIGSAEARLAYTNLTWEKNYNLNIGLDLTFLNRFNLIFEFYNRDTEDLLLAKSVSQTTGFGSTTMNLGSMNNRGIELTLESVNIRNGEFFWKTSFNLSHNRNKLTKLDGVMDETTLNSSILRHRIGKDFNTFYLYEYAGVDPKTGKESYYVNQGDNPREITTDISKANKVLLDKVNPTVQGGVTNTFSYKGIDLGFTFTYSLGGHLLDLGAVNGLGASGGADLYLGAIPSYYKAEDIWQKEGDQAKLPRFVYQNKTETSSRYVHSTDHLRLKNITLGYKLPASILRPVQLDQVRVFASAVNLFTIKNSDLPVDPEMPMNQTYGSRTFGGVSYQIPALRTVTFGVEVTF